MRLCAMGANARTGASARNPRPVAHYNPRSALRARSLVLFRPAWVGIRRAARRPDGCRSGAGLRFAVLQNLELAFKVCAFLNRNSAGLHVSIDHCGFSQFSALAGLNITVERTSNSHILHRHIGVHPPIRTDRQAVPTQLNTALHLAINVDILAACELAFNAYRLSVVGKFT